MQISDLRLDASLMLPLPWATKVSEVGLLTLTFSLSVICVNDHLFS